MKSPQSPTLNGIGPQSRSQPRSLSGSTSPVSPLPISPTPQSESDEVNAQAQAQARKLPDTGDQDHGDDDDDDDDARCGPVYSLPPLVHDDSIPLFDLISDIVDPPAPSASASASDLASSKTPSESQNPKQSPTSSSSSKPKPTTPAVPEPDPSLYLTPIRFPTGPSCGYLLATLARHHGPEFVHPTNPFLSLLRTTDLSHLDLGSHHHSSSSTKSSSSKRGSTPQVSKWARKGWVNLDKVYDAMERVLDELRRAKDMGVFEKPVTEHEAPGYSLVISHPMSFETIKEKMRERAYKSKQAFVHDLQLIYDNCMAYNIAPTSPYRGFAKAFRDRYIVAVRKIPDLMIYHESDPPAEIVAVVEAQKMITEQVLTLGSVSATGGAAGGSQLALGASSGLDATQPLENLPFSQRPAIKWDPSLPVPLLLPLASTTCSDTDSSVPSPASATQNEQDDDKLSDLDSDDDVMSIDPITNASAPCDAPTRSHAAALVSLRAWHSLRRRSEYIHSMTNDHLLRVSPAHALAPLDFSDVEPEWGAFTMEHCANADAAHLSLRRVMALLLGHLGFTGCRPSVLYVMADLYVDALTRMAGAARTVVEVSHDAGVPVDVDRVVAEVQLREWAERGLSDNQEAKSRLAEEKLRVALETAGVDPLGLHDHAVLDVCRAASRLGELERRVEGRVRDMLFGTSSKPTNPLHLDDLPDPSDDPDFFTSGSLLSSILGEDILGLSSLGLTPNSATASSALVAKSRTALAALPSTSLWIKDHKTGFYYKRVTDTETDGDPEAEMVARWKGDKALEPWRPVVWIEVEQPPANEEEAGVADTEIKEEEAMADESLVAGGVVGEPMDEDEDMNDGFDLDGIDVDKPDGIVGVDAMDVEEGQVDVQAKVESDDTKPPPSPTKSVASLGSPKLSALASQPTTHVHDSPLSSIGSGPASPTTSSAPPSSLAVAADTSTAEAESKPMSPTTSDPLTTAPASPHAPPATKIRIAATLDRQSESLLTSPATLSPPTSPTRASTTNTDSHTPVIGLFSTWLATIPKFVTLPILAPLPEDEVDPLGAGGQSAKEHKQRLAERDQRASLAEAAMKGGGGAGATGMKGGVKRKR